MSTIYTITCTAGDETQRGAEFLGDAYGAVYLDREEAERIAADMTADATRYDLPADTIYEVTTHEIDDDAYLLRVPHQMAPDVSDISAADVAAVRRWHDAGSITEASTEWESATDAQRSDAEEAVAWGLQDLHCWQIGTLVELLAYCGHQQDRVRHDVRYLLRRQVA